MRLDVRIGGLASSMLIARSIGIARLPDWVLAGDIEAGRLRRLLPDDHPTPLPMHIGYLQTRLLSMRARCFIEFLRGERLS